MITDEDLYNWTLKKTSENSFNIIVFPKYRGEKRKSLINLIKNRIKEIHGDCIFSHEAKPTQIIVNSRMSYSVINDIESKISYTYISNKKRLAKENSRIVKESMEKDKYNSYIYKHKNIYNSLIRTFGAGFANKYNIHKLIMFIVGDDKKFNGLASPAWIDGLRKSNSIVGNNIDFDSLKEYIKKDSHDNK